MQRCDVLIVGGGPAGSSCAWRLRQAGLAVLVLDKCTFPRDKTCAGWITPEVVESLQLDLNHYQQGRTCQPINGFRVGLVGGRCVDALYQRPVSYGIRRCEFDQYLLLRSEAPCRLGEPLVSMERVGDRWLVNETIETPLVVGAGGHFCPVARMLNSKQRGPEQIVAAQEVEFEMSEAQRAACPVRPDVPELYFCQDLCGYGWCFRKGNYLNVGLGREDRHRLSEHVRRFVEQLKSDGRIPADTQDTFKGHAYILYGHGQRTLIADGVMLVGDAAGLAHTRSGEGIQTAVESGLLAAETIIASKGNYQTEQLRAYTDALIARYGRPESSDGWQSWVPMQFKQYAARWLFANHWFARHVVLDRWFLHLRG
jgi:menaquinone-9 beta-reductase